MEELLKVLGILLLTVLGMAVVISYILMCFSISHIEDQVNQIVKHINAKKLVVADEKEAEKEAK